MVLHDLDEHIPHKYFEQEVKGFDSNIQNSVYLSAELKWGVLAAKLGRQVHFDSSVNVKPRQISASELLMNLGMLAASKAQQAALENLSQDAKRFNLDDGNAGAVSAQLATEHIPAFQDNIRGGLAQYFKYLSQAEREPFRSLLDDKATLHVSEHSSIERSGLLKEEKIVSAGPRRDIVDITKHHFRVALSFPGEVRPMVSEVSSELKRTLGSAGVFYDNDFIPQLARPSLDTLLQDLYRNRADLIIVFISDSYQEKKWCGIEFRAIREIIFEREHERIMFVRTGDGNVDGVFNTDGYVDARKFSSAEIAEFILERLHVLTPRSSLPHAVMVGDVQESAGSALTKREDKPFDISGRWDIEKAKQIASAHLASFAWTSGELGIEEPISHTFVGEYHLLYRAREGVILAYGSIEKGSDCHACAPYLSLFEFEEHDGSWKLVTKDIAVCQAGQWGQLPKIGVHAFADSKFGVLLQDGYMAQGWGIGLTSVYVRVGDAFKEVLMLITSQSDPEGRSWGSKFTIRPTTVGLYDIEVQRSSENTPDDMVFMEGDIALKFDVSDNQGRIRAFDLFKFDGQCYRRHDILS